jgi:hypothetical protein
MHTVLFTLLSKASYVNAPDQFSTPMDKVLERTVHKGCTDVSLGTENFNVVVAFCNGRADVGGSLCTKVVWWKAQGVVSPRLRLNLYIRAHE